MSHPLSTISAELNIHSNQVEATLALLAAGATVPFIARYRKEITGSLDEVQIAAIRDMAKQLEELAKRRETILKSIEEQGKLSPELAKKIGECKHLATLEDIYLPYKPKRKTRALVAREKGLEPLALLILAQKQFNIQQEASRFINTTKDIKDTEDALAGARDIIAEIINEDSNVRGRMRPLFSQKARITSVVVKGKENEGIKYKDYFTWEEAVKQAPSHRILALFRGEEEGFLKLTVLPPEEDAINLIQAQFITGKNDSSQQVALAIHDGYRRLLRPAMETELRAQLKQKADDGAILVFAQNARQLLMAAPLGQKQVLAIDPGFRTGCKVVCLNAQGVLLENFTIYPHSGPGGLKDSELKIRQAVEKYQIEAIAIGNGTAGRETETFIRSLQLANIPSIMVNESGASIYSASACAREEFPTYDVTVRGAVSIGRRLMDPLAELVKIEPKSIGVGQYQHDVDQKKLQQCLDDTVMSCVNAVGVEVNTASKQLLAYVSGLSDTLAQNIVDFRQKNGPFKNRESLKKVARLGEKAFEQAAGFLRIHQAEQVLDASGVHPERYDLVEKMAKDLQTTVLQLIQKPELQKQIRLANYVSTEVGVPTLNDILNELAKPGRDPREQFEVFRFEPGVNSIADLKKGMKLKGIVTNITNFGAFVDIGVHQDGLVHTSQLANRFVANPNDIVKVAQVVQVTVTDIDLDRKRISLSMKEGQDSPSHSPGKSAANIHSKTQNTQKEKNSEGDLQTKLTQLKNKFK